MSRKKLFEYVMAPSGTRYMRAICCGHGMNNQRAWEKGQEKILTCQCGKTIIYVNEIPRIWGMGRGLR